MCLVGFTLCLCFICLGWVHVGSEFNVHADTHDSLQTHYVQAQIGPSRTHYRQIGLIPSANFLSQTGHSTYVLRTHFVKFFVAALCSFSSENSKQQWCWVSSLLTLGRQTLETEKSNILTATRRTVKLDTEHALCRIFCPIRCKTTMEYRKWNQYQTKPTVFILNKYPHGVRLSEVNIIFFVLCFFLPCGAWIQFD